MKETIIHFWNTHQDTVALVGKTSLKVLGVILLSILLARMLRRSIQRASGKTEWIDATLLPVITSVSTYSIYAVGAIILLDIFGVNTTSLIAVLGAVGIAIGMALKDTLSNVAAGIMLLVIRPFRVGDYIECGEIKGEVKETDLYVTALETPDGLFVSTPNTVLWGSPIMNFTRNGRRRIDLTVQILHSDSVEKGLEVLAGIASQENRFLSDPAPMTLVHSLGDNGVTLLLRAWVPVDQFWDAQFDLQKLVKEQIEGAGLTIPFPQRSVHISAEAVQALRKAP